jgi:hypothetical protein
MHVRSLLKFAIFILYEVKINCGNETLSLLRAIVDYYLFKTVYNTCKQGTCTYILLHTLPCYASKKKRHSLRTLRTYTSMIPWTFAN